MNRWLIALSITLGILLTVVAFQAKAYQPGAPDDKKEKRTINTSGTSTVRVKPDSARVFFGVQTLEPTIKEARTKNAARVKQVMEAVLALKIPNLKMKTSDISVELVQSHRSEDKLPQILGYRVTNSFTVLVTDKDVEKMNANAGKVLDTALENGANIVQQIMFFKQDNIEAKREALAKAVQEAEANAHAIARGANVLIKDTIALNGQPEYHYYYRNPMQNTAQVAFGGEGGGETPLVAGDLEVTCTVNVTCTY
jgi:hypothetical protein